jgi:hypothetical protein
LGNNRLDCSFMRLRIATAVAASIVLAALFATHAFTHFTPVRVKVIRTPIASVLGRMHVPVPPTDRVVEAPAAIVWNVRNLSASAVNLLLSVDGRLVCTRRLAAGASARFDCQDQATNFRGGGQDIEISGAEGEWAVSDLEVAVHHGRTSDPENLVFLPAGSHAYDGPSVASVVVVWLALALELLVPAPARRPRWLLTVHRVAVGAILLVLLSAAVSALVSPYSVIVSAGTFVQWLVILCAWRLWAIGRWLVGPSGLAWAPWLRQPFQRVVLAACVFLAFGSTVIYQLRHAYEGNYSGFLHISKDAFDHNTVLGAEREVIRPTLFIEQSGGYDGQWVYFMTFDPLLRKFHDDPSLYNGVVDAPPYRYARMGLSTLARLVSGGRWSRFPIAIVWIVWLGTVGAALALAQIARANHRSPWLGALVIVVPGFWLSVGTGLSEPFAAALMLTALLAAVHRQWAVAAVVCAASLLTRETGLICACTVLGYAAWRGEWRRALIFGAIALAPLAIWRLYVGFTLHPVWGTQAFFYNPDDIGIPFNGIKDLWSEVRNGTYYSYDPGMIRAAIAYPILLTTGLGLAIATTMVSFNPCAMAAIAYGLLAVSLRFGSIWVHVGNGQRGTFELFVMLAVSSTQSARWPRWLRLFNVLFWTLAILYVFYGSFDAGLRREGLVDLF